MYVIWLAKTWAGIWQTCKNIITPVVMQAGLSVSKLESLHGGGAASVEA